MLKFPKENSDNKFLGKKILNLQEYNSISQNENFKIN
jgi:hypothetical protein